MTDVPRAMTGAFSTSRRFQVMSLSIAAAAFGLVALQTDAVVGTVGDIAGPYSLGVLSIVAVLLILHFLICMVIEMKGSGAKTQQDSIDWYKSYFARFPLGDNICALIALVATSSSFSVHKAKVIGADGFHFDDLFIKWDRLLFAGRDPWELTHAVFPSASMTRWIDFLYHPAFLPMVVGYVLCFATQARPDLRYTYMLSYLASFVVIGMVMASGLSSVGPVYYDTLIENGQVFSALNDRLAMQSEAAGPFTAVFARDYLLNLHTQGEAGFFGGISAMPSMHVTLALMWAFGAWHINRVLGVVMTVYAALIWIGSVHLAWHYFVDGLVGLVALAVIWAVCGRAMGLYGEAQVMRATT